MMRTDSHNNPTAMTTAIAHEGGLVLGTDYTQGDSFKVPGGVLYTARLIGDPIALTIKVIDDIGFYTLAGAQRWTYIGAPRFWWNSLPDTGPLGGVLLQGATGPITFSKRDVIGFMYAREAGVAMRHLFPNYGKL